MNNINNKSFDEQITSSYAKVTKSKMYFYTSLIFAFGIWAIAGAAFIVYCVWVFKEYDNMTTLNIVAVVVVTIVFWLILGLLTYAFLKGIPFKKWLNKIDYEPYFLEAFKQSNEITIDAFNSNKKKSFYSNHKKPLQITWRSRFKSNCSYKITGKVNNNEFQLSSLKWRGGLKANMKLYAANSAVVAASLFSGYLDFAKRDQDIYFSQIDLHDESVKIFEGFALEAKPPKSIDSYKFFSRDDKITIGNDEFNNYFTVYGNEINAHKLLNATEQSKLIDFVKKFNNFAIEIIDGEIKIYFPTPEALRINRSFSEKQNINNIKDELIKSKNLVIYQFTEVIDILNIFRKFSTKTQSK